MRWDVLNSQEDVYKVPAEQIYYDEVSSCLNEIKLDSFTLNVKNFTCSLMLQKNEI